MIRPFDVPLAGKLPVSLSISPAWERAWWILAIITLAVLGLWFTGDLITRAVDQRAVNKAVAAFEERQAETATAVKRALLEEAARRSAPAPAQVDINIHHGGTVAKDDTLPPGVVKVGGRCLNNDTGMPGTKVRVGTDPNVICLSPKKK